MSETSIPATLSGFYQRADGRFVNELTLQWLPENLAIVQVPEGIESPDGSGFAFFDGVAGLFYLPKVDLYFPADGSGFVWPEQVTGRPRGTSLGSDALIIPPPLDPPPIDEPDPVHTIEPVCQCIQAPCNCPGETPEPEPHRCQVYCEFGCKTADCCGGCNPPPQAPRRAIGGVLILGALFLLATR